MDSTRWTLEGSTWTLEGSPCYIIIEVAVVQFAQVKLVITIVSTSMHAQMLHMHRHCMATPIYIVTS